MADPTTDKPGSPVQWFRRTLRAMWNDARSVYYANTPVWRVLKSAALVFLGLFCWAGANLVLSYSDVAIFRYVMAYGFALLVWGPLTHFVVVPLVIRLRRSGATGVLGWFSRHGSKANLTVFFLIVLVLGTYPIGVMTFSFTLPAGDGDDINPNLQCTRSSGSIHCHLDDSSGIDHVVVSTAGEEIERIEEPPFDFDVEVSDLQTVRGDEQFTVELQNADGDLLRRYNRRADLVPPG